MPDPRPSAHDRGAPPALLFALVVAVLYLARDLLIPLALAILLAFLLAPAVARLERLRIGHAAATALVVTLAFAAIVALLWLALAQLAGLVDELPRYRAGIVDKLERLRGEPGGLLERAARMVRELGIDLGVQDPAQASASLPASQPAAAATMRDTLQAVSRMAAPLVAPLATLGATLVFTVVILLQRADLRDRFYRLAGQGRISLTANALGEAADRVSRFLRMQVLINVGYGLPVGLALAWLGVPNAALWGIAAAVLRFVPYAGPWIAAAFPLMLAAAIGDDWSLLVRTAAVFVVLELVSNNLIEPWLYGASTGLSPVAVLASALFWTWLWGLPGLLLAVPLTVCLAVVGRHIPRFEFLDVILGDAPVLAPHERLYQRLLADEALEAQTIVDAHRAAHGRCSTADDVLLPALHAIEDDRARGRIDEARADAALAALSRLPGVPPPAPAQSGTAPPVDVLVVAAHDEADRLAAQLLADLLAERDIAADVVPESVLAAEVADRVAAGRPWAVCLSAVPPMASRHLAYLCKRVRPVAGEATIVACPWGLPDPDGEVADRLVRAGADVVAPRLDAALEALREPALRARMRAAAQPEAGAATPAAAPG